MKKKSLYKTGGGPEDKSEKTSSDNTLLAIIDHSSVYGLNNPFDCDSNMV